MKRHSNIVFLIFGFAFIVNSQTESIKISGDSLKIYKESNSLLEELYRNGYITARIDSLESYSDNSIIHLNRGHKVKWGKVHPGNIESYHLKKAGINLNTLANKPYNQVKLEGMFAKIIEYYENMGYPFVKVSLKNIHLINNRLDAELYIKTYEKFTIDSLIIKGNTRIDYKILEKIINIKSGETYNQNSINKISRHINNTSFISEKKPFEIEFSKKKASLYTYLIRRKSNQFDGIIGFLPDDNTNKLLITGDVNLYLKNSFNKAETLSFSWRKLESSTQELDIRVKYPYFFYTNFGGEFKFNIYKKDSSYINVKSSIGTNYVLESASFLRIYYQRIVSNTISSSSEAEPLLSASTNTSLFGVGYFYSSLDYLNNPAKGIYLDTDIGIGRKKLKDETIPRTDGALKAQIYFPLYKNIILKYQNNSAFVKDEQIYKNELLLIGGLNTIRGFIENSIAASLYSISTLEIRYIFEKNSNIYLFTDIGYYESNYVNTSNNDTPLSFGVGLQFFTNSGIFSLNYALGKQFDNPILLNSGKIHVGYINRF